MLCVIVCMCVYVASRGVYYHLCNLSTAENHALRCGCDVVFLTWTIKVLQTAATCFIGKNSTK